MKRVIILAAALAIGATGAAHAQGSASKKYDWTKDGSKQSCLEPYAPAVPKAKDTSLKEMAEQVRPDVEEFIKDSNKYLDCIGVQIAKAQEDQDQERIQELIKVHNDNVNYQKSVAAEFNATVKALKAQSALSSAEFADVPDKPDASTEAKPESGKAPDAADAGAGEEKADEKASEKPADN